MIEIRVKDLLLGRTYYWLAKETSISHTTLWRLKKARRSGLTSTLWRSYAGPLSANPATCYRLMGRSSLRGKTVKES